MKIKQYGPRMEELKREGKTNREIAADVGLKYEQVKRYFSRERREQNEDCDFEVLIGKRAENLIARGEKYPIPEIAKGSEALWLQGF